MKIQFQIFNNIRDELLENILKSKPNKEKIIIKSNNKIEENSDIENRNDKFKKLPCVDEILLNYSTEDFSEIGRVLIKENRLKDCLELTREIFDYEELWNSTYRSYITSICKYSIQNNDIEFLNKIEKVINQWLELLIVQEINPNSYFLTKDEILAQESLLIMSTYIDLAKVANKKDSNFILNRSLDFLKSIAETLKSDFIDNYEYIFFKVSDKLFNSGFQHESGVIIKDILEKPDSFTFTGFFNYLFLKDTDLKELDDIANDISTFNIESSSGFLFDWWNLGEEKINFHNRDSKFMFANSGQSGLGPLLMKDSNEDLKKSSMLNLLFLKYCKIDEYSKGKEHLNESIRLIKGIDDMYIKSRGYYLIMTVLADALSFSLTNQDDCNEIFNNAIYYASLVRDNSGDFSCFCFKYNGVKYRGIVCDRCSKEVNGKGFKKITFDYLFHAVSISKNVVNINNSSINRIIDNFKDDLERLDVICRIIGLISSKKYVLSEHINNIINSLESNSVDAFLKKEDVTLLEWYNNIKRQTDIFENLAFIFPNGLSGYMQHHRDHFDHDDDFWREEEFLNEVINNTYMWPEDLPDVNIDEEDNYVLTEDVNANLHLLYIAEENQEISEDVISKYLSDMDPNKIQHVIARLLIVYITLIREYNKRGHDKDYNNCISHYFRFLNLLKDSEVVSKNCLSFLRLLIDINNLDKHLDVISYLKNKKDVKQFSDYFVSRYSFIESILFSYKLNSEMKDSFFSISLSNNFDKSTDIENEKYMFLSNFNESTDSLLNYLKYEKNNIYQSNNEKANLLSEVFDSKTQKIEDSA